jgi:hypothetical protein
MIQPEAVLANDEPEDLAPLDMAELRSIRERLQEVELGYSYARRVVQGRLDVVLGILELHDRHEDPIAELSEAMASHIQGPGLPRPTQGLLPPDWADELLVELERTVPVDQLAELADKDPAELVETAERISAIERDLSQTRSGLHTRIERIQAELIARYRRGAGVDDLLS